MARRLSLLLLGTLLMVAIPPRTAQAAELKSIHTQKTKDVTVTLANEAGQFKVGKNDFVVEFTAPTGGKPVDVGTVALDTAMPMPGMAPMLAGATVTKDTQPGRYRGTITFPDAGSRQVTVRWDGPAGKGTTRFSVPVR
jgi:hypothetical protein